MTRTASCAPWSTVSSSTTSSRRTPCRPTRRHAPGSHGCSDIAGTPERSELDAFESDHRAHQFTVRTIHERLFFAPLLEALGGIGPPGARSRRGATGGVRLHRRPTHARCGAASSRSGSPAARSSCSRCSRSCSSGCRRRPIPTSVSSNCARLAEGPARSASLATTFRDAPGAAERACYLLGSSRVVGDALRRHPEFVEELGDDEGLRKEKDRDELIDRGTRDAGVAARRRTPTRGPPPLQASGVAAHRQPRSPRIRAARSHRA